MVQFHTGLPKGDILKAVEFCYWLQGFFEISDQTNLTTTQVDCVRKHLNMVFRHEIDPSYKDSEELNKIHNAFNYDAKLRC